LAACERTGWWNLHLIDPQTGAARTVHRAEEDFAGAQRLGLRWFAPLEDGRIAVLRGKGAQRLAILGPAGEDLVDVPGDWSEWLPHLAVSRARVAGVAAGRRTSYEVVDVDTATFTAGVAGYRYQRSVDPSYLPEPMARVFEGPGGREGATWRP
jgi:hypothetical protein